MYLKEITTSGFKSFAEKIDITLDNGITCIVGPNGSGKSNIVDAVRWVLGEQSVKSLRGDGAMSDVIFSGSKSRNPLNVASVTLTFDNSDNYLKIPYTEISVKRRVYRTGENEYFLNGEKCRLKDITELLLDSGIGKESFNIISQGEVDRILSSSSQDRRIIFEEAAGVLKYKKRKEEALRKLERTHQNLDRVNDIIHELELQLEPLQEQSAKAKEYLVNKEGLEKLEVACLVYDITTINDKYTLCKEKKTSLEKEILTLSNKTNTEDTKITLLKQEIETIEALINKKQNELVSSTKEVERLKGKRELLKERQKNVKEEESTLKLRSLKEQEASLLSDKAIYENDLIMYQADVNKKSDEVNYLAKELLNITNEQKMLQGEYDTKTREIVTLKHRLTVIQSDIENDAFMPRSVKELLQNKNLTGIYLTIGQALFYDEKYIKAVDIATISCRNFIITEDNISSTTAINYLKDNHLGRATFFPLNVIKPRGIDYQTTELLTKQEGYISSLIDVVKYDEKYHNVISNQLGNILLVDTLEHAQKISRVIDHRYKIVTLDGDVLHVGGSMTGGSTPKQNSIGALKQELLSLENKIASYKEVIIKLEHDLHILQEKQDEIRAKNYQYLQEKVILEEKKDAKEKELTTIIDKLELLQEELNSIMKIVNQEGEQEEELLLNQFYEKKTEVDTLTKEITSNKKELETKKQELESSTALDKLNQSSLRKMEQEIKELDIEISKMDVRLDTMLNQLSNDYTLTFEKAKEKYFLDMNIDEAKSKVQTYKANIKRIGMVNLDSIEEEKRIKERYDFLKNQEEDLLGAKETLLEIMNEMDEVMKKEFATTFDEINKEFKEVFKELFKGGSASLKLTDPDNLLETGVEIIASPPGKRLTTISLLSGGEKTLTAISLLFAILNVRTVPFCLFDEVEAALDEANVDQFGKYLDHYKDKTQFLIITHKKKTMEYADTLYGITMQESGVSKLVSVRLNEKEEIL